MCVCVFWSELNTIPQHRLQYMFPNGQYFLTYSSQSWKLYQIQSYSMIKERSELVHYTPSPFFRGKYSLTRSSQSWNELVTPQQHYFQWKVFDWHAVLRSENYTKINTIILLISNIFVFLFILLLLITAETRMFTQIRFLIHWLHMLTAISEIQSKDKSRKHEINEQSRLKQEDMWTDCVNRVISNIILQYKSIFISRFVVTLI